MPRPASIPLLILFDSLIGMYYNRVVHCSAGNLAAWKDTVNGRHHTTTDGTTTTTSAARLGAQSTAFWFPCCTYCERVVPLWACSHCTRVRQYPRQRSPRR